MATTKRSKNEKRRTCKYLSSCADEIRYFLESYIIDGDIEDTEESRKKIDRATDLVNQGIEILETIKSL